MSKPTIKEAYPLPTLQSLEISHILKRRPNLHAQEVYEQVYQHAQQMGLLIDPHHYTNHITMNGYVWPHTSAERLAVLSYFNTLGYFLNDTLGRDITKNPDALRAVVAQKAYRVLVEGLVSNPPDRYDHAFNYLRKSILALSNEAFAARFFPLLLKHWQAGIQHYDPYQGNLEEYIATRRHASGMLPTIMLVEFAYDCYMPKQMPQIAPNLEIAIDALADIGAISNDIFSFAKESHTTFNIIRVLQRERGYESLAPAIDDAIGVVNHSFRAFQSNLHIAQEQVKCVADAGRHSEMKRFLNCFVNGLWDVAAACYHWQMETNRYRHQHHPIADLQVDYMT
ncbi:MAG: hypothetical protein JXB07_13645 [Anaerolineae bacterium]|nr:hypothetical protein [Anaerolineae bacterium]